MQCSVKRWRMAGRLLATVLLACGGLACSGPVPTAPRPSAVALEGPDRAVEMAGRSPQQAPASAAATSLAQVQTARRLPIGKRLGK